MCTVSTPRNDRAIPPKSTLLLHLYVECKNVKHIEHTISKVSYEVIRKSTKKLHYRVIYRGKMLNYVTKYSSMVLIYQLYSLGIVFRLAYV